MSLNPCARSSLEAPGTYTMLDPPSTMLPNHLMSAAPQCSTDFGRINYAQETVYQFLNGPYSLIVATPHWSGSVDIR